MLMKAMSQLAAQEDKVLEMWKAFSKEQRLPYLKGIVNMYKNTMKSRREKEGTVLTGPETAFEDQALKTLRTRFGRLTKKEDADMFQGILALGRAQKSDVKKSHSTYTLLWPVFQKAQDAADDAEDEESSEEEEEEVVSSSSKKQPKQEEDTQWTDFFEQIIGAFAVCTNLNLSKDKQAFKGKAVTQKEESAALPPVQLVAQANTDQDGGPKDVLAPFIKMAKYCKQGLDAVLSFHPAGALAEDVLTSVEAMVEGDDASKAQLRDETTRLIVVRQGEAGGGGGAVLGFVHFKFDVMEDTATMVVLGMQLAPSSQRKGMGKFIMTIMELTARKQSMGAIRLLPAKGSAQATSFISKKLNGFERKGASGANDVWVKSFVPAAPKATAAKKASPTTTASSQQVVA